MPRPRKPLDFEQHVRAITKVAGVKRAPEQLSLDELRPAVTHDFVAVIGDQWSYSSRCRCGWSSRGMLSRADAWMEYKKHLARTPQGTKLIATLRRVGRSAHGS